MHTGDGPCRQGQYINICKLCLSRMKLAASDSEDAHLPVKFLENIWTSRHDKQDFLDLIDKWAAVQGFQALAIKDVLHTLFLTAGSGCHSHHEYQEFISDYQELKKTIYRIIENDFKPAQWKQRLVNHIEKRIPPLHGLAQYVGYGLYNNNGLRRVLNSFGRKWVLPAQNGKNHKIRIHVD